MDKCACRVHVCTHRRGLRKMGVSSGVVAVWSDEPVKHASLVLTDQRFKQSYYGTISYIPA